MKLKWPVTVGVEDLPGGDRVDGERLVALGEDEDLLGERRLEVFAGGRVADLVFALAGEGPLDQALAGTGAARHPVHFAVGEHPAAGLAAEAAAAVGDVAHLPHRLLEADHDVAALALVQRGEGDPPALAHGRVAAQRRCWPGGGRWRRTCRPPRSGSWRGTLPPLTFTFCGLDAGAVEVEGDLDPLAGDERLDRADHRHRAHDLGPAAVQVADLDLHGRRLAGPSAAGLSSPAPRRRLPGRAARGTSASGIEDGDDSRRECY